MGSQPQSASATPTTTHVLGARSLTERRFSRQAASDLAERDAQRPAFANGRGGSSRATVKYFSPDGKSYLELRDADADKSERGELFLRHLSRSIALQRDFSTESLTVSTRCGNVERQTEQAVPWLADD